MPALLEQQKSFAQTLFNPADSYEHLALQPALGSSVAKGMAIYRNNVFSNYRRMLSSTYPVIERLVGADFFAAVGDDYIQATPSRSGDIRNYGEQFAEFLSMHRYAGDLVYLKDVARIEWACHKVMQAPPQKVFALAKLYDLPQEQLNQVIFDLSAACRLVSSPYPALTIWQANQPGYSGEEEISLDAGSEYCLVLRHQFTVQPFALSAAEFEFLTRLSQRQTLEGALHAAQSLAADFNLKNCLQRHISDGVISGFTLFQGA